MSLPRTLPLQPVFGVTVRMLLLLTVMGSTVCGGSAPAQNEMAADRTAVRQQARPSALNLFRPGVWGTKTAEITNFSEAAVEIVTGGYFGGSPLRRYARRVTLPAESTRRVSFSVLPTITDQRALEWHSLLYSVDDRDGSLLRAADDYMIDSELLIQPAEPITVVIADTLRPGAATLDDLLDLAVATRITFGQTRRLVVMDVDDVPVRSNGLNVVDHIVLGSDRIADDPACLAGLRLWVEQGGLLWIRLDLVDVATVNRLFGDDVRIQFASRTSQTSIQIVNRDTGAPSGDLLSFDYPVDHVRVLATGVEVIHDLNNWPASFTATIGNGRVLFTTLGNRGWIRGRTDRDQPVPPKFHTEFLARQCLTEALDEWTRPVDRPPLETSDFDELLTAQVGYRIPGKGPVLAILGLFCAVLTGTGLLLHSTHRRTTGKMRSGGLILRGRHVQRLAVIGPALAILAAVPIVVLGQASRSSIPASINLAEFIEVMPATSTLRSTGSVALYAADAESIDLVTEDGRILLPPQERLTGTLQEMVQTDYGESRWSDLRLHAGLQLFSTSQSRLLEEPMEATVSFGPDGAVGTLAGGSFKDPEEVLIASRSPNVLAVTLNEQNQFRGGAEATLAPDVYIPGALLNDQQVQRQHVYRSLLEAGITSRFPREPVLLAWMHPHEPDLTGPDGFRITHQALLAVPVEYRLPPPGTDVFIPSTFLTFEAATTDMGGTTTVYDNRTGMWSEGYQHTQTLLRFTIPPVVQTMTVNRVNLEFKLLAPGRKVSFSVGRRGNLASAGLVDEAAGTYAFQLDSADQVQLDPDGGYYVEIGVQPPKDGTTGTASRKAWKMDFVRLEMHGRTADDSDPSTSAEEAADE